VVAGFSEIDAAKIKPGQVATVTVDALPNEKFAAHVLFVDTLSTVTSNVVTNNVTFVLDNPSSKVKPV
jgi:multidrug resistance efflux pump